MDYLKKMGLVLLLASCSLWTVRAQDAIVLSNEHPTAGERVHVTFRPAEPALDYLAQVFVFHPSGYNADDVDLEGLEGSFLLPDSAMAFLVNFTARDTEKKSGLVSSVYQDGKPVQGAYYAHSLIYDGFGEHFSNIETDREKSLNYLEQEFQEYPESKEKWLMAYLHKLPDGEQKEKARQMVDERVEAAFDNPESTEKELRDAFSLLSALGERDVVDSLAQITVDRYPNGVTETFRLFTDFRNEADYAKKVELYDKLNAFADEMPASSLQFMHGEMAKAAAKEGDLGKLDRSIAAITNPASRASALNSIAWPLAEAGENLEQAEKLSRLSVELIEGLLADAEGSKPASTTLSQWKRQLSEYSLPTFMDTYALIRHKQGSLDDALQYQRQAVGDYHKAEVNERFVQYLKEAGLQKEALQAGERATGKGKATAQTKAYMQEIYIASGKTEQEFADYYARVEADYLHGLREELQNQLLDEEAPQFDLKNLDGESVTSESMLGKVYVVDFWATWCGPCLASFPAMQTAVNKFADRDDVEFLFVNTWENIPDREDEIAKFIDENEYTFHVLFDTVDDAKQFDLVSAYKVSGIPTKFVIDKAGKIRFKAIGFGGSAEEEVHKLSVMIELATDSSAHGGE